MYGQSDYEQVAGTFTNDVAEMTERYGGQWATAHYHAGDVVIFGMYTMHGSLTNTTDRYRMSADIRYQLKSEPFDPRWHGDRQVGEKERRNPDLVPMETARKMWGV